MKEDNDRCPKCGILLLGDDSCFICEASKRASALTEVEKEEMRRRIPLRFTKNFSE